MAVEVTTDMERGFAQLYEIQKRFLNGSLSPRAARQPLQDIVEGKFESSNDLDTFTQHLLSPEEQLNRLRRYNARYWDNRLTDDQLAAVDTSSKVTQRITHLTIFHVQFDSLEETVEMWWRVYVGEQPSSWRWDELKLDPKHLRLLGSNVHQYESGIHRVHINLVAHWEPEDGRTLEEVRESAESTGEILAQLEVLSAYGLHSELFREQDGENLPYSDMAGTDASVPGDSGRYALYVYWDPFDRRARLYAGWVDDRGNGWAAPVVWES